jgi:hypothetical protein
MDVEALLNQLTLEEKVQLTAGKSANTLVPIVATANPHLSKRCWMVAHSGY